MERADDEIRLSDVNAQPGEQVAVIVSAVTREAGSAAGYVLGVWGLDRVLAGTHFVGACTVSPLMNPFSSARPVSTDCIRNSRTRGGPGIL